MKVTTKTYIIISIGILVGLPIGTSTATFVLADGFSYLSGNPKACVNCHIMNENYNSWESSSHHGFASCNDCHTNGTMLEKYSQKALNGFLHSFAFTTGFFSEPIRIKEFNRKIVIKNCLSCHSELIASSRFGHVGFGAGNCLQCHQNVGHRKW